MRYMGQRNQILGKLVKKCEQYLTLTYSFPTEVSVKFNKIDKLKHGGTNVLSVGVSYRVVSFVIVNERFQ